MGRSLFHLPTHRGKIPTMIDHDELAAALQTIRHAVSLLEGHCGDRLAEAPALPTSPDEIVLKPGQAASEALARFKAGEGPGALRLLKNCVATLRLYAVREQLRAQEEGGDESGLRAILKALALLLVQQSLLQKSLETEDDVLLSQVEAGRLLANLLPEDDADWVNLIEGVRLLPRHLNRLGEPVQALGVFSACVCLAHVVLDLAPERTAVLAAALERQAGQYVHLGRIHEALRTVRAAAEIYRAAGDGPAATRVLLELSGRLADRGCAVEALALAEEGSIADIEIASEEQPAQMLDLAQQWARAGRVDEAIDLSTRGLMLMRRRLAADPTLPDRRLARALPHHARLLEKAGQFAAAAAALEEAVQRLRAWPGEEDYRVVWLTVLAKLLTFRLNRQPEAVSLLEEAVELRVAQADQDPKAQGELVETLCMLGIQHTVAGNPAAAVPVFTQAVALQRLRLQAASTPEAVFDAQEQLVACLFRMSAAWLSLGHLEGTRATSQEMIDLLRGLTPHRPALRSDLAQRLTELASLPGDPEVRLSLCQEAVEISRALAEADPTGGPGLANALHRLGQSFVRLERWADALPAYQEALGLHEAHGTAPEGDAWFFFFEIGGVHGRLDQPAHALPYLDRGLTLAEDPAARAELARARGHMLDQLGREPEALQAMAEAIDHIWAATQADTEDADALDRARSLVDEYLEWVQTPSAEVLARARALGLR